MNPPYPLTCDPKILHNNGGFSDPFDRLWPGRSAVKLRFRLLDDFERFKLLYGPYVPPQTAVGDKLLCEYRGHEVTVLGISEVPIPWPSMRRGGNQSPILCGDLVRAVRVESEQAVAYHYAVAEQRRRLGISRRVAPWTPEQIALLGTASDREVGRATGRSESSVHRKREALGIPSTLVRWTEAEIALLGAASDAQVARNLGRHPAAVQSKREKLGIPPFTLRWTDEELSWLGTDTDKAVARCLAAPPRR